MMAEEFYEFVSKAHKKFISGTNFKVFHCIPETFDAWLRAKQTMHDTDEHEISNDKILHTQSLGHCDPSAAVPLACQRRPNFIGFSVKAIKVFALQPDAKKLKLGCQQLTIFQPPAHIFAGQFSLTTCGKMLFLLSLVRRELLSLSVKRCQNFYRDFMSRMSFLEHCNDCRATSLTAVPMVPVAFQT